MIGFSLDVSDPKFKIYIVEISGVHKITVTVTATPSVVKNWLKKRLRDVDEKELVAGIGVEWTHGSEGGEDRPADTLQICIDCECLVFQLSHSPRVPDKLRAFLSNPFNKFYGLWNDYDRRKLEISNHALVMARDPLDASLYAATWDDFDDEDLSQGTLNDIVEKSIGIDRIDLDLSVITMSDWYDEDLSPAQIVYATVDAYAAWWHGDNGRELQLIE